MDLPPGLSRRLSELFPGATLVRVRSLAVDDHPDGESAKAAGYGEPLRIELACVDGGRRELVMHVSSANDFGHDRRSDRAAACLLGWDTFAAIPRHVAPVDVGAISDDGALLPLDRAGELYLLTDWAPGAPYADDLRRVATAGQVGTRDLRRARALARYLVELHAAPGTHPGAYTRSVRDLVGSGEGIAGIVDGYPDDVPGASRGRLERIEQACLAWRFETKRRTERLRRIHGDFHPFNIVFRGEDDFSVLDASRGCEGDPADDVTGLSINYLFFGLGHGARAVGLGALWSLFWETYLAGSGDEHLLEVVAPYLAWRCLVLACPRWYPHLPEGDRDRLLSLAERALASPRFEPAWGLSIL